MKTPYQELFDEVRASRRLNEEVINMTKQERTQAARKISVSFVAAAALAALLAGTALAAVIGVPETMQEWFGRQWTEAGGGEMPVEQSAVIEGLVQPVGVRAVDNGITVTLDSVTPGENCIWMLLTVEGAIPKENFRYIFDFVELTGPFVDAHQPTAPGVGQASSWDFPMEGSGVTSDGNIVILIRYHFSNRVPFQEGGEMELHLENMLCEIETSEVSVSGSFLSGQWVLPFQVEPVEDQAVLTAEYALVPSYYEGEAPVPIRDIRVSSTGLTYIVDAEFTIAPDKRIIGPHETADIALRLSDGMEVCGGGQMSTWAGEFGKSPWESRGVWPLPVDVSKVESIRFGDVVVPLQQPKP